MATTETKLLTAEEYLQLGDNVGYSELIAGITVTKPYPGFQHGRIGSRLCHRIESYLQHFDLGAATLSSGIITERDPDTVRGVDIAFYSYQRIPLDEDPVGFASFAPEIVWEVLSPTDRHKDVLGKVHEYLEAGVLVVCVIDPAREYCITYFPDQPEERLNKEQVWRCETILPGFELSLAKLFAKQR